MTKKRTFWDTTLIHPFLFAVYALLALWNANITEIPAYAVSRAALLVLIFVLLGILLGRLLFRDRVKAAVFASLFTLLFLTYGHVFALVDAKTIGGFLIGRHRFTLPLWIGMLIAGGVLIWRIPRPPLVLNRILNIVSLFLVVTPAFQIISFELHSLGTNRQARASGAENSAAVVNPPENAPDVYYIVLDGYARADMLQAQGGPDITPFLDELTGMGFYIARCALANYDYTALSISSSLNMNYMDALDVKMRPGEPAFKYNEFETLLQHSLVRKTFERMGYQFITFKGVPEWLNAPDSDIYYDAEAALPFYNRLETVNFQYMFLSTTLFRPMMEIQVASSSQFEKLPIFLLQTFYPKASKLTSREHKQYQQSLYALRKLSEVPELPGKKFVYAHLFTTHQPYVFNQDGTFRWGEVDNEASYFVQVQYTNQVLPNILRKIIQESKVPPVIILQSDHGYVYSPERTSILSAYYMPNGGASDLHPGITPVNSFRYLLNRYFDGNYPLLPDLSYHSDPNWRYRLTPVAPNCPADSQ